MVIPCSKVSSRSQTVLQTQAKPSQAVPTLDSAPTRRQTTVLVSVSLSETSPAGHGVDADDSASRGSLRQRRLRPSDHDSAENLRSDRLLVLQVMEWTQTILQAGEAFTGGPCADLRAGLQKASGRFFPAHHSANVSLAVSLLDAELWTPLPVPAAQ